MDSKRNTSQVNISMDYQLTDPKNGGIGGSFSIPDDTFKITVEEAIDIIKSYRCSIDEKLCTLQTIATKRDCEKAFSKQNGQKFDEKALKFEEIRAQSAIDLLQLELNRWLLGNGGISLTKTKSN